MNVTQLVKGIIDRISGRPAADERDERLERVQQQLERQRRLRLVEERQDIKRRVPDV